MLKTVLIDDEKRALDVLMDLLHEHEQIEVSGTFTNPLEAIIHCRKHHIDVVFLDMEMPGMNGLDAARQLIELNDQIGLVFITAHNKRESEAWLLRPIDFLLKPVGRKRMRMTVKKLRDDQRL